MVGIKEILAIKANRAKPSLEQREYLLIRVNTRRTTHLREKGGVDTDLVIFDVVAIDAYGRFPVVVGDGVALGLHGVNDPITNPLAQAGETPQPAIGI